MGRMVRARDNGRRRARRVGRTGAARDGRRQAGPGARSAVVGLGRAECRKERSPDGEMRVRRGGAARPQGGRAGSIRRARGDQTKCWPPLMVSVEPFTKPASSLARYSTAWAISSASPRRPVGIVEMILLRMSSATAITISVAM
jgi:hypothetical protein